MSQSVLLLTLLGNKGAELAEDLENVESYYFLFIEQCIIRSFTLWDTKFYSWADLYRRRILEFTWNEKKIKKDSLLVTSSTFFGSQFEATTSIENLIFLSDNKWSIDVDKYFCRTNHSVRHILRIYLWSGGRSDVMATSNFCSSGAIFTHWSQPECDKYISIYLRSQPAKHSPSAVVKNNPKDWKVFYDLAFIKGGPNPFIKFYVAGL